MGDPDTDLPNPYLASLDEDTLYHLGYSKEEAKNGFNNGGVHHTFSDVKARSTFCERESVCVREGERVCV